MKYFSLLIFLSFSSVLQMSFAGNYDHTTLLQEAKLVNQSLIEKNQFSKVCFACQELNLEETVENYCKQFTHFLVTESMCKVSRPKLTTILGCYAFSHDIIGETLCLKQKVEPSHAEVCKTHIKDLINHQRCMLGISKVGNKKFGECFINTETIFEEHDCIVNLLKPYYPTEKSIEDEINKILEIGNSIEL